MCVCDHIHIVYVCIYIYAHTHRYICACVNLLTFWDVCLASVGKALKFESQEPKALLKANL